MIQVGEYTLPLNFEYIKNLVNRDRNDPNIKSKTRGAGIYYTISQELQEICREIIQTEDDELEWIFEIFYSYKPVGLHNDSNYDATTNSDCKRVAIIPIDWSDNITPLTIVFDIGFDRKIYDSKQSGKYVDAVDGKIYEISDIGIPNQMFIDDKYWSENISHLPKQAFNGLQVTNEFIWKTDKFFTFDSTLLHIASKFKNSEWKLSLNGLGFKRRL